MVEQVLKIILLLFLLQKTTIVYADWDSWWTYEGISGPDFWGRLNPKWSTCSKGRRQSPVNIDTERILYDPYLTELYFKGDILDGILLNTGRSVSLVALNGLDAYHSHHAHHNHLHHHHGAPNSNQVGQGQLNNPKSGVPAKPVTVSGGPLSYAYTLSNVTLHFGRENGRGSEHSINGQTFAGELQLYAFNGQLYSNWSEARRSPNGLAAISALIKVTRNAANANSQLKTITSSLRNITNRGDQQEIRSLSLRELLPPEATRQYVTYEGSLTQPACFETVQWIVLNKPVYMSAAQFHQLRTSLKGDGHQDNYRPIQLLNGRPMRSNIVANNAKNNQQSNLQQEEEELASKGASSASGSTITKTFKYNLMHSSEEVDLEAGKMESMTPLSSFSKDLCYVNRPVAYKMNAQEMEVDF